MKSWNSSGNKDRSISQSPSPLTTRPKYSSGMSGIVSFLGGGGTLAAPSNSSQVTRIASTPVRRQNETKLEALSSLILPKSGLSVARLGCRADGGSGALSGGS